MARSWILLPLVLAGCAVLHNEFGVPGGRAGTGLDRKEVTEKRVWSRSNPDDGSRTHA